MRQRFLAALFALGVLIAGLSPAASVLAQQQQIPDHVPNRVVVGITQGGKGPAQQAIEALDGRIVSFYEPGQFFIVDTPSQAPAWARSIQNRQGVRYAELDYIPVLEETVPNDPQWGSLWGMQKIQGPAAWDSHTGSSTVVVGVIDTGIDYTHEDLAANMWVNPGEIPGNGIDDDGNGWVDDVHGANCIQDNGNPMDDDSHGSHVAGTIGAVGNNGVGVVGVSWNVRLMALRGLGFGASTTDAIQCLDYSIAMGAHVTNNSWSISTGSQALYDAIVRARNANQLFVAAAGNQGQNLDTKPRYPAAFNLDNIISVAASDETDQLWSSSNWGPATVDLAAPGVNILSTTLGDPPYFSFNGTSMAAPHVTGAAALLLSTSPGASYASIRDRIFQTVDKVSALNGKMVTGGRLNVAKALFPPPAPTSLTATAASSSRVDLAWSDVQGESGYRVERSPGGTSEWSQVGTTGRDETSFSDTGLSANSTYYYRVVAANAGGSSGPSNTASATTLPNPPSAPESLTATAASSSQIDLSWSDVSGETGYRVERSPDDTTKWTEVGTTGQDVTSYSDTGLAASITYHYRVVATNSGGESPPSSTASATTLPNPPVQPEGLTATAASSSQIDLSWSDVSGETGYRVERSANGTTGWTQIGTTGQDVTTFSDTGLEASTTYYYRVVATNVGGDSAPSAVASATTGPPPPPPAPEAPSSLTAATASSSQIDLSWSDVEGESGYRVERSADGLTGWTDVGTTGQDVTSFSDTGLSAGTTYHYRVVATNAGGDSGPSPVATATTLPNPPPAPASVTATAASSSQIDLSWSDVSGETGYRVERSANGTSGWTDVGSTGQDMTSFSDTGLSAGTTYYYRVVATNAGGDSGPSPVAFATTLPNPPDAPTSLTAAPASSSQIDLSWSDVVGETSYGVERSANGTSGWTQIGTTGQDLTSFSDTGLAASTTYHYRVVATNAGGSSGPSNTASATTLSNAPSAPSSLTATTASSSQIDLSWSDVDDESGYRVERSADGQTGWTDVGTTGQDVTSFADSGLAASTTYHYRVVATNAGGDSGPSPVASATTLPNPPAQPEGLTATTASSSQIDLSWSDVSGETGYRVERSLDGASGWAQVGTTGQDATSYADPGLSPDTTYHYRVVATNAGGDSAPSNVASATTGPPPPPPAPEAPSSLTATTGSSSQIDLSWSDVEGESAYRVERSSNGNGGWTGIGTTGQDVTSFSDTGLSPSTTYHYRVVATNAGGDSAPSPVASATTLPNPPDAPSSLTATTASSSQIDLSWSDVASETGYRVERSLSGTSGWAQIGTTGQDVTAFSDTGLSANTTYHYRIIAMNAGGDSAPSSVASATTLPNPPSAPASLTAVAASSTQIDLAWSDVAGETGYRVERSANGTSGWSEVGSTGQDVTSFSDTGLAASTTYHYRVVATSVAGDSSPSPVASGTTFTDATPPTAPTNLSASGANARITLRWTASTDSGGSELSGYEIWRASSASGPYSKIAVTTDVTFTNDGLPRKTTFWYYVVAFDGQGNRSGPSNIASARTA